MKKYKFEWLYNSEQGTVEAVIAVISFHENDVDFLYSPALDLSGYGNSKAEAESSFKETLGEFLRYTLNKGTLVEELKRLGWNIKGSKTRQSFTPPHLDELFSERKYLTEIVREKEFSRSNVKVAIPAQAWLWQNCPIYHSRSIVAFWSRKDVSW